MPTAISDVDVVNLSLDLLRHSDKVTDISDPESETEALAARWYDVTRRSILRAFPWNFARKRTTLSRNATAPSFGYADAYKLPNDYLELVFIGENYDEDYQTEYSVEDGQILLDNNGESGLQICYIQDVTQVGKFDALFLDLFVAELAIRFANALTGINKSMKEIISWRDALRVQARTKNGQENPIKVRQVSQLRTVRRMASNGGGFDGIHVPGAPFYT
jgi:hypothetical protein